MNSPWTVSLQNSTTRTELPPSSQIELVSTGPDELSISVPRRTASTGHHLQLAIEVDLKESGLHRLDATAIVLDRRPQTDATEWLNLKLLQWDAEAWALLQSRLLQHQLQIEQFLAKATGRI